MSPRGRFKLAVGCGLVFTLNGLLSSWRAIRGDFADTAATWVFIGIGVVMMVFGLLWLVGAYRLWARTLRRAPGTAGDSADR